MPNKNKALVQIKGVHKWFKNYHALRNVNLDVQEGEIVVLCGASGSGKSTLVRCINGLEAIDKGTVVVDGHPVTRNIKSLERVRKNAGMVFQQFNLFPHLSVIDNLTLAPVHVKKMPRAEARKMALDNLTRVQVDDQAHKFPAQLSGGQQQRVAIARALCMSPRLMLLDEPTSALDPEMIKGVLDVLIQLAKQGVTMVVVTHEMQFARSVANRVLFMDVGEIVEQKPPEVFFTKPEHWRARLFVSQIL